MNFIARIEKIERPPDRYVEYATLSLSRWEGEARVVYGSFEIPLDELPAEPGPAAGREYDIAIVPRGGDGPLTPGPLTPTLGRP